MNLFKTLKLNSTVSKTALFSVIGLATFQSLTVFAQQVPSESGVLQDDVETIVTVGSRRPGRTAVESNVPVDAIDAEALTTTGFTDVNRQLQGAIPSFNYPQPSVVDGTEHIKPASLRGLAPDQTLVLINGKRRHSSALLNLNGSAGRGSVSVDLNSIPSLAIQRVEVLRDGAAAQYGSDAIAGVINIVTKTKSEGGSIIVKGGFHATTLDGVPQLVGIQQGANGYPVQNGGSRLARINSDDDISRTDGETLNIAANYGLPIGEDGYFNITGDFNIAERTNRGGQDDGDTYPLLANGERDPRELTVNRDRYFYGNPASESYTILANAGYDVSDDVEFYSTATFQNRDATSGAFYREASDEGFGIQSIYPDGFTPRIHSQIDDVSFLGGVRGMFGEWNYDFSGVWGRNKIAYTNKNTANTTYLEATPTEFYGGALEHSQATINADFSRLFDVDSLASPLSFAFGAEYRKENYSIESGDPAAYTNQPLLDANGDFILDGDGNRQFGDALLPVGSHLFAQGSLYFSDNDAISRNRDSIGLYAELDADITDKWNVTVAGRFEEYSDFGSTFNGKIAMRYNIVDDFALRGSFSTGFRAPSLHQQFYTSTVTLFTNGVPSDVGTLPATSPAAMALGGTQLQAEKSKNYSLGFTWTPTSDLTLTVDAYRIEIDDRIVLSETLGNNAEEAAIVQSVFAQNNIVGVGSARFFINGVDSVTEGVDVTASYSTDIGNAGDIRISGGFNYNKTEVSEVIASAGPSSLFASDVLFSRRETKRLENAAPKTKTNITINWDKDDFGLVMRGNYYGSITQPGTTEAGDVTIDPAFIFDMELNYQFTETVSLALGVNNLFDKYPESAVVRNGGPDAASQFNYIFPYPGFSAYGFQGRYVYARTGIEF